VKAVSRKETYCLETNMKKTLLQLQALPGKQWIALEGADLARSNRGNHAIRMNVSIPCADNPTVDEFLLAKKVRKLANALKAEDESLRMIALMRLGFTVPAGMPTVWEMAILGDATRALSKKTYEEQAEKCLRPHKPFSCSAVSWTTEVGILLNRTYVPPSLHPTFWPASSSALWMT
jgi:hypothetical protein